MNAKDFYIECAARGITPTEQMLLDWLDEELIQLEHERERQAERLAEQAEEGGPPCP
jgi:hypothetical protein